MDSNDRQHDSLLRAIYAMIEHSSGWKDFCAQLRKSTEVASVHLCVFERQREVFVSICTPIDSVRVRGKRVGFAAPLIRRAFWRTWRSARRGSKAARAAHDRRRRASARCASLAPPKRQTASAAAQRRCPRAAGAAARTATPDARARYFVRQANTRV
ncbi:hypothetical protein [Paraburkholderia tagetis]|uniref:Uncharacterized protein n=1 Tax=Paraburkholderia tagetis TaxID=2913261 RepID=A0A9X2A0U1_9BURK|nr:hypothetical protein [Paraburkholderia tagetis]MCG5077526.1 hypothetical protein [Paraburkholderia tagetis]